MNVHPFDLERLIAADPDYYLIQKGAMNRSPVSPEKRKVIQELKCIKNGNWSIVDETLISRPGPNVAEAVKNARFRAGSQGRRFETTDIQDFMGEDEMFPMVFQDHQRKYIEKLRARIMMYKPANRGKPEPLPDNPYQGIPWTEDEADEDPFLKDIL